MLCLITGTQLRSQNLNDSAYYAVRYTFVVDKTDKIVLSVFNRNPDNGISFRGTNELRLNPNDPNSIGLKLQHKWLGVEFAYSPRIAQLNNRGNTRLYNLHMYCYGRKLNVDAYFIQYNGYYIDNNKQPDSAGSSSRYILLPGLRTLNTGIGMFYLFNHKKYSLRSGFLFNEIQQRSAGSFIIHSSLSYFQLYNPQSVISNELRLTNVPVVDHFRNGDFYSASIMPGYFHTFVFKKKFFFTIGTSVGPMLQLQSFAVENLVRENKFTLNARASSRSSLGYNGDRFFVALLSANDVYNYNLGKSRSLGFLISEARLVLGYRFDVPRLLKPISNSMEYVKLRYR